MQEAEHYAKVINCEAYYANAPDKANIISRWLSAPGYARSIVATTALGMGVDYNKIRFVIYLGALGSMTKFAQGSGRAGAAGNAGYPAKKWAPAGDLSSVGARACSTSPRFHVLYGIV